MLGGNHYFELFVNNTFVPLKLGHFQVKCLIVMLHEVSANDRSVQYTSRKSKSFTDQTLLIYSTLFLEPEMEPKKPNNFICEFYKSFIGSSELQIYYFLVLIKINFRGSI